MAGDREHSLKVQLRWAYVRLAISFLSFVLATAGVVLMSVAMIRNGKPGVVGIGLMAAAYALDILVRALRPEADHGQ